MRRVWRATRLVSPADGYQSAFRPALRRALLAWRCANVLLSNPAAPTKDAIPRVRPALLATMRRGVAG